MNIYDIGSMNEYANARYEQFREEARQAQMAREIEGNGQPRPSRFRRAIGMRLIDMGGRLSGIDSRDIRRTKSAA